MNASVSTSDMLNPRIHNLGGRFPFKLEVVINK